MAEQETREGAEERGWRAAAAVLAACAAVAGILGACSSERPADRPTAKAPTSTPAVVTPHPKPASPPPAAWRFDAAEAERRQNAAAARLGASVQHIADLGNGVTLPLVLIPPGEFDMGSPAGEESLRQPGP